MTHGTHDALPEKACVWMEAGVLKYWLCDRAFECEHCPLDQALRGGFHGQPPVGYRHVSGGAAMPPGIRFHPSHLWIAPITGEKWALGLDHQALGAFSDPPAFSLPRAGRHLDRNSEILALLIGTDALRWPAPVDAIVLEQNPQWAADAASTSHAPYAEAWALLLKLRSPLDDTWLTPEAMAVRNREEAVALRDFVMSHQDAGVQSLPTAADGGTLIAAPDRLVPISDYLTFLRQLWQLRPNAD